MKVFFNGIEIGETKEVKMVLTVPEGYVVRTIRDTGEDENGDSVSTVHTDFTPAHEAN